MDQSNRYEKRKHTRVNAVLKADIFTDIFRFESDPKFLCKGYITDISIGGLKIETNNELEEGNELLFKFFLPNGQYLDNIKGRIVRAQKDSFTYTYGIRFVKVSLFERLKMWWFITRQ